MSEPNSDIKRPVIDPVTGLLPCPFCGGETDILPHLKAIECCDCGCLLSAASVDEARAAWNRRTP
jgi:hypothetical protein